MQIDRLEFLVENIGKLRAHGITVREVRSMIESDNWVSSVHRAYPNQVRVIGPTPSRRWLTVALEPTDDPRTWRPVTGWDSSDRERAYYWEERP